MLVFPIDKETPSEIEMEVRKLRDIRITIHKYHPTVKLKKNKVFLK